MPSRMQTARCSFGLAYWMRRVLEECDKVGHDFSADPVHDLRVALRRCRSMADGLMTVDRHPAWKQMKQAGKRLFSQLGELRDAQVMTEWVQRLGSSDDPATQTLLNFAAAREQHLKQEAIAALTAFDRQKWKAWSEALPKRADRVPLGSLVFRHLALERWNTAYDLHRQALRNRTKASFHRLRIGLKRFRYTAENFLPRLCERWEDDLKHLQDLLGEVHDLDVLWATAWKIKAFPDESAHARWRGRIEVERAQRLQEYRRKMLGKDSLWQVWRSELPQGAQVETGALQRLKTWAAFLDPDFGHAQNVARLALQLYDGLARAGLSEPDHNQRARSILRAGALMHDVGRAKRDKKHHKISAKWIRGLSPPLGWQPQDLQAAALLARYHRGALPGAGQKRFVRLPEVQKKRLSYLAGILRLAEALDSGHHHSIRSLEVEKTGDFVTVWVQASLQDGRLPQKVTAARHLLETACHCPFLVRPGEKRPAPSRAPSASHRLQ